MPMESGLPEVLVKLILTKMEYLWKENYPILLFTENPTVNTTFTFA